MNKQKMSLFVILNILSLREIVIQTNKQQNNLIKRIILMIFFLL